LEDEEEDVNSYWMTLRKWYQKLKQEAQGCTLEKLLWKSPQACCKRGYGMKELVNKWIVPNYAYVFKQLPHKNLLLIYCPLHTKCSGSH
jgi:hypothetical protein